MFNQHTFLKTFNADTLPECTCGAGNDTPFLHKLTLPWEMTDQERSALRNLERPILPTVSFAHLSMYHAATRITRLQSSLGAARHRLAPAAHAPEPGASAQRRHSGSGPCQREVAHGSSANRPRNRRQRGSLSGDCASVSGS